MKYRICVLKPSKQIKYPIFKEFLMDCGKYYFRVVTGDSESSWTKVPFYRFIRLMKDARMHEVSA